MYILREKIISKIKVSFILFFFFDKELSKIWMSEIISSESANPEER